MVNFDYYNAHFSNLTEVEFNKIIDTAESFVRIRARTHVVEEIEDDDTNDITDVRIIPYKNAICAVAEKLSAKAETIRDVNSISNDGYSESYISSIDSEVESVARFYLKGTGVWGLDYV